jgi:hypothetical protein
LKQKMGVATDEEQEDLKTVLKFTTKRLEI